MVPWGSGLGRSAHVEAGHLDLPQQRRSQEHAPPVETALDGKETPLAPATSLARLRKQVLDLVMSRRMKAAEACRSLQISRSRFYELRARYLTYGEAGLLPKPRPATRPDRRLPAPLTDQIIAYAIHHPTEGPRTIAAALALARFGSWRVSHGGVSNVLSRAGLSRVSARLAAAEALSAAEGGIFKPAARAAGVSRSVRVHDLRHSSASIMAAHGFTMVEAAAQLGHSATSMTALYSHSFAEVVHSKAQLLDNVMTSGEAAQTS